MITLTKENDGIFDMYVSNDRLKVEGLEIVKIKAYPWKGGTKEDILKEIEKIHQKFPEIKDTSKENIWASIKKVFPFDKDGIGASGMHKTLGGPESQAIIQTRSAKIYIEFLMDDFDPEDKVKFDKLRKQFKGR